MSEIISVHVGQAGVQIGNAVWELYCLEHGIAPDGTERMCTCGDVCDCTDRIESFFKENPRTGRISPLATIVDSEPSVVDEIRTGAYRSLFSAEQLITGREDASNNFARGYYRIGASLIEAAQESLKINVEKCDSLCGLQIYHALGGGTGSGFLAAFLGTFCNDDLKCVYHNFSIFPSPHISTATVEPYNAVLFVANTLDRFDCTIMFENEAIYELSANHLKVEQPTYTNINRLIAQVASSITASLRFEGALRVTFHDFQTNLVPFPQIHFNVASYAPLNAIAIEEAPDDCTVNKITNSCFKPEYAMVRCAPSYGQIISSCLLYRGDICPADVYKAVQEIKNNSNLNFVEFGVTGFKIGINYQPMMAVPECLGGDLRESRRALCSLVNSTSFLHAWNCMCEKFDLMWHKRAFVHWFLSEGIEEDEFVEARNKIDCLVNDYSNV